jgi:hypothetical protein
LPHSLAKVDLSPQETKPRRFITEISLTNDFQCHEAAQIDVERL